MKYLVIAKPGQTPIPMEQGVQLLKAAKGWMQGVVADGSVESNYNFFGGGGFAVSNADSHEQLLARLLEYPLYAFFTWEVQPILEFDESLEGYIAFYEKITSMTE